MSSDRPRSWRHDAVALLSLLALMGAFTKAPLLAWAPRELQVMEDFHLRQRVAERCYRGLVFAQCGRAGTQRREVVDDWQGDLLTLGLLPADVSERVEWDLAYDANGFPNPAGRERCRVACVGDSQTECGWPREVEAASGLVTGNFGVRGLAFAYLAESLEAWALPQEPDVVVLGIYGAALDRVRRIERGRLRGDPAALPAGPLRSQLRWSRKFGLPLSLLDSAPGRYGVAVATRFTDARDGLREVDWLTPLRFRLQRPEPTQRRPLWLELNGSRLGVLPIPERSRVLSRAWDEAALDSLRQVLSQAQGRCAERGIALRPVFLPVKARAYLEPLFAQIEPALLAPALGCTPDELPLYREHLDAFHDGAQRVSAELGLDLLDTTSALVEAVRQGQGPYHLTDTHLNAIGNRIVGELVAQALPAEPVRAAVEILPSPLEACELAASEAVELSVAASGGERWLVLEITAERASSVRVAGPSGEFGLGVIGDGERRAYYVPLSQVGEGTLRLEAGREPWRLIEARAFTVKR